MTAIARRIAEHGGAALVIDYGYMRLHGMQAVGDTLQAARNHQFHDALHGVGSADITAHVDFSALADAAVRGGAQAAHILSQREFLRRMGGELRVEQLICNAKSPAIAENLRAGFARLTEQDAMGELFLVLAITPKGVTAPVF